MPTVTYKGPTDPAAGRSDSFRIDEHGVTLRRDVPQKVSEEVAAFVDAYPDHDFEVRSSASRNKSTPQKPDQGATEED